MCRIEREVGTPTSQRDLLKSSWNGPDADGSKKHNPDADLCHQHDAHIRRSTSIERQIEVPRATEGNLPKLRDRELELVLEKCTVRSLSNKLDNVKILGTYVWVKVIVET